MHTTFSNNEDGDNGANGLSGLKIAIRPHCQHDMTVGTNVSVLILMHLYAPTMYLLPGRSDSSLLVITQQIKLSTAMHGMAR